MTYMAQVVEIESVYPHSNADRIQLASVSGAQVVVGLDVKAGDLGIYFPTDGKLSLEFAEANDLVGRVDPVTGERAGGFFDHKLRVRTQKFRGEKSDGFWIPVNALDYIPGAVLEKGMLFDTITDSKGKVHPICEKYFSPATLNAMKGGTPATKKKNIMFLEHADTTQLRHYQWPKEAVIYVTYKLHGTSGRTGRVLDTTGYKRTILDRILRRPGTPINSWTVLHGTRRTVLADGKVGFYGSEAFRRKAVENIVPALKKGETIYYELVGYTDSGQLIMGEQDTTKAQDKELVKQYGKTMRYTYGCAPGECQVYVYRITMTNEDGDVTEVSWPGVKARCNELGLKYVPEVISGNVDFGYLNTPDEYSGKTGLDLLVEIHTDGHDPICPAHIREGIVFRVEHEGKVDFVKNKSFTFKLLEGIAKLDDSYVDTEEIS